MLLTHLYAEKRKTNTYIY